MVTLKNIWAQRQNFTNKSKEIWEYKQKESEWVKTKNLADGYKKVIEELSAKIVDQDKYIKNLGEEIEKLVEEKNK